MKQQGLFYYISGENTVWFCILFLIIILTVTDRWKIGESVLYNMSVLEVTAISKMFSLYIAGCEF